MDKDEAWGIIKCTRNQLKGYREVVDDVAAECPGLAKEITRAKALAIITAWQVLGENDA